MPKILDSIITSKRHFDPYCSYDREIAIKFLNQYSWVGVTENSQCPFICEWPHLNIPAMLKDKLLGYFCKP